MKKQRMHCWACHKEWDDYPGGHSERAKAGQHWCPFCRNLYWSADMMPKCLCGFTDKQQSRNSSDTT